MLSQEITRH